MCENSLAWEFWGFGTLKAGRFQEWVQFDWCPIKMAAGVDSSKSEGDLEVDRLASMLKGYPSEQLVEEVVVAWNELSKKNDELVELKRKNRVLELDLEERKEGVLPEIERMKEIEEELENKGGTIIRLERLLEEARNELDQQKVLLGQEEREGLLEENEKLFKLTAGQDEIISELENKIGQLLEAIEKAANAGLASITADEVQGIKDELDEIGLALEDERSAKLILEGEKENLIEVGERLGEMLEQREKRISEMEMQIEKLMHSPRSISAEHDYLAEQIDELKRRLMERNREYEALRRRERKLHGESFEKDEKIQELRVTMSDLESALQDRTAELKVLEEFQEMVTEELEKVRRNERTNEVIGKAFAESLELVRYHDKRVDEKIKKMSADSKSRTIESPSLDDMHVLADGGTIELGVEEKIIEGGIEVDRNRPKAPGGSGDPAIEEE